MSASTQTVESAKLFLLSKLDEQGLRDGVSLTDIEKRMFMFSEAGDSTPDFDAAEQFDAGCDSTAYEKKIAKILRRCYARDKKTGDGRGSWKEALQALRDEDFYGLVMVDQAGIRRPRAGVWKAVFDPMLLAELAVMAIGFVVVFRPDVLHLALPDWLRLLLLPVFFYLMWLTGEVLKRRSMK